MDRAGLVLISRRAAQRMVESYPQLHAHLGDVQDATAPRAAMVFDPLVHPENRRYLTDQEAFCYRWRVIGDPAENSKSGATRSNR